MTASVWVRGTRRLDLYGGEGGPHDLSCLEGPTEAVSGWTDMACMRHNPSTTLRMGHTGTRLKTVGPGCVPIGRQNLMLWAGPWASCHLAIV